LAACRRSCDGLNEAFTLDATVIPDFSQVRSGTGTTAPTLILHLITWRFAPGSDLIFVWKNAIYNEFQAEFHKYGRDLIELPQNPQSNGLSLKMLYWLDYATLKSKF
jgi:hypothetical protein